MRRIKIFAKALSGDEIGQGIELLEQAGFKLDEVEVVPDIGAPTPDCDDELVLVILTQATCADPDLEQELAKTPNGGRRAICVWPKNGEPPAEMPPAVGKYGYSVIPWDFAKLRLVTGDGDQPCFETSSGEPLPTVQMERNLCVEEEVKLK